MDLFTNFLEMMDLAAGSALAESYLHYDKLMEERTIVPGSLQWYTEDASSVQMNERSIQGASNTRVRFGPCQMCTHPALNVVEWSITLDPRQYMIQFSNIPANATGTFTPIVWGPATPEAPNLIRSAAGQIGFIPVNQTIDFWIGFPHASAFAQQRILLPAAAGNSKTTLDYAAQEALISMLSIPKQALTHNEGFLGIEDLMMGGDPGCGTIVRLEMADIKRNAAAGDLDVYATSVGAAGNAQPIDWVSNGRADSRLTINGIIDFNFLDPLYTDFCIMTPQWNNTFLQFNMNRVLQNLQVIHLNQSSGSKGFFPVCGGLPPDKPQVISMLMDTAANVTSEVRKMVRFVNIAHWNQAATVVADSAKIPCWNIKGKWNHFRTRQVLFILEDQEEIMANLIAKGTLITPVKHFTTYTFNGVGFQNSMVSTGISTENIDKIYVQLPYLQEVPLFLPNPLLTSISPSFKRVLFTSPDEYIDVHARQKVYECFVDTDKSSPSRNLGDSLNFKNNHLHTGSDGKDFYGMLNLWDNTAGRGLMVRGSKHPVYFPNQFVYAVDLGHGNEFRGANSKMPGSVSSYNSSETFKFNSTDYNGTTNITRCNLPVSGLSWSAWIGNAGFGCVSSSTGTALCTVLSYGRMITHFNKSTGAVEQIIVE